jgi:hypothetical protein
MHPMFLLVYKAINLFLWNCVPLLPYRSLHLFLIRRLVLPAVQPLLYPPPTLLNWVHIR